MSMAITRRKAHQYPKEERSWSKTFFLRPLGGAAMLHLVLKLITQIMQYILLICDRYSLKGAGVDAIYGLKLELLKEILSVKRTF